MDDIIDLLKQLGVITIGSFSIVGLIGYLGKNLFEKYLDSKINIHKSHLDKELERFKAELNKEAYKFQTKFSNLHIERAQVTRDLYKKLFKFYGNLKMIFLHGTMIPTPELYNEVESESLKKLSTSYAELFTTFEENKIMFSREIADKLNELTTSYWDHEFIYQKFRVYENMQEYDKSAELEKEKQRMFKELYDVHYKEIPSILQEIENEFRELLGVEK